MAMWVAGSRGTGGKVISMSERRGAVAEHPALAQLRAYWEGLRAGGDFPTRAMIDPRGIEGALEFAFVAERIAPGAARIRLAGMHLNELLGMEVRGMPLSAFFDPCARDAVAEHVEAAFAGPAVVMLTLEGVTGFGRPALTARLILLPLRDEAGGVVRVLGGFAAEGGIGRPPRRFRLAAAQVTTCTIPTAPAASAGATLTPVTGFAEAPTPWTGGAAGTAPAPAAPPADTATTGTAEGLRRGALRLVHSSD
jgi:hypothetical protein